MRSCFASKEAGVRQKVGTLTTAATGSELGKVAAEVKQTKVPMILCNLGRSVKRGS